MICLIVYDGKAFSVTVSLGEKPKTVELNEAAVQLTTTLLIKSCETQRSSSLSGERECEERGEGVKKKDGVVRIRKRECERQIEEFTCV